MFFTTGNTLTSIILTFAICTSALRHWHVRSDVEPWRIKVYYINMDASVERAACLNSQLNDLEDKGWKYGLNIVSERFPAVSFSDTCKDAASCIADQPSCFPTRTAFASHGKDLSSDEENMRMIHGVFGDACSHLRVLEKMKDELDDFDYFVVLEDDVGIDEGILENFAKLFGHFPDHWSMITIDSFPWPQRPTPDCDVIPEETSMGLPLSGISATRSTYWGSQAWLFNADKVPLFFNFYADLPLMNADWYTKVPRPLHLGMWGFTPGQMQQMRFVDTGLQARLTSVCSGDGVIKSDIAEMALNRDRDRERRLSVMRESSPPRELLIFGMKGAGAEWVQALVHEKIEKPLGVVLCDTSTGKSCGGVSAQLPPKQWGEKLSQYSEAVAIVVVRHPFALVEELRNAGEVHTSVCPEGDCDAACESDAWYEGLWSGVPCEWSAQMKALGAMSGKGPFHKIVVVRFEDAWEFPNRAITKIAKAVGVSQPPSVVASEVDLEINRQVGKPVQLSSLEYKTEDRCGPLSHMCKNTHQGEMWKYGYHGCQLFHSEYSDAVFENLADKKTYFANCKSFMDDW